jgi:hypothetical protein
VSAEDLWEIAHNPHCFCQWGVNAGILGARDMGLALSLAWVAAIALIASLYATPVLVALGLLSLIFQRHAGLRFLAAGAVTALPLAVLTWIA